MTPAAIMVERFADLGNTSPLPRLELVDHLRAPGPTWRDLLLASSRSKMTHLRARRFRTLPDPKVLGSPTEGCSAA